MVIGTSCGWVVAMVPHTNNHYVVCSKSGSKSVNKSIKLNQMDGEQMGAITQAGQGSQCLTSPMDALLSLLDFDHGNFL